MGACRELSNQVGIAQVVPILALIPAQKFVVTVTIIMRPAMMEITTTMMDAVLIVLLRTVSILLIYKELMLLMIPT